MLSLFAADEIRASVTGPSDQETKGIPLWFAITLNRSPLDRALDAR